MFLLFADFIFMKKTVRFTSEQPSENGMKKADVEIINKLWKRWNNNFLTVAHARDLHFAVNQFA